MLRMILRWDDVDVDNDIEIRRCWCWEWYWDEMMLMLIMTLRWNVDDVENALWWCMLCMYMGGAMTLLDIPGVEKRLLLLLLTLLLHVPVVVLLSSTILSVPPLISLAKTLVGSANSSSRIGLLELALAWMQKLTFPLRYPKMVPVIVVEVVIMSCCCC